MIHRNADESEFDLEIFLGDTPVERVSVVARGLRIGRATDSDLVLANPDVSLKHAMLVPHQGGCGLTDLVSTHGTIVAGQRIHKADLPPGGEFQIGPYTLRLLSRASTASGAPASGGGGAAKQRYRQFTHEVHELTDLVGLTDLETVLDQLLERTSALLGAQKGFVVLASGDELSAVLAHHAGGDLLDESFSRSVCRKVLDEGKPVEIRRPEDWSRLGASASIVSLREEMALGIPLHHAGQIHGVLYLQGLALAPGDQRERSAMLGDVSALGGRALHAALERHQIIEERERWRWLATGVADEPDLFRAARSRSMQEPLRILSRVAGEELTVVILGESGTGKEVVARSIHRLSPRREGPFIAVNCAAIPKDLVEAELFGHEAGAFTGATGLRRGWLELAQGGTLLLDEVGDLPLDVQAKLLRVLETRSVQRIGSQRSIRWDARLLAATNRDLEEAMKKGDLRSDFFYRLSVVSVRLPPLRDRPEDIELLAHELLVNANRRLRRKLYGITPEALLELARYSWPGNIRELRNVIERAFALESSDRITTASLALPERQRPTEPGPARVTVPADHPIPRLEHFLQEQERLFLSLVLDRVGGNITRAAEAVGLTRQGLHKKLKSLGLRGR